MPTSAGWETVLVSMTARQRRRNAARAYARRWLDLKEDEDREGPLPPIPRLDFAVCVEGELPYQYNYASEELEFFNANAGVDAHRGQAYCRGKLLKDALCRLLRTPRWGIDKDGKTWLLPGNDPLFHAPASQLLRHAGQGNSGPVPAGFGRQRQPADAALVNFGTSRRHGSTCLPCSADRLERPC